MRKPYIAGNWKMNKTPAEAQKLVSSLKELVEDIEITEIGVCPTAVCLPGVVELLADSIIKVGAQNMHWEEAGAYTGEISGPMLKELGLDYVIIGHSERRQYFEETDQSVNRKVKAAFNYDLRPIICVGETLQEREEGKTESKVKSQIKSALAGLDKSKIVETVIAYEPIWAIGTGESATAAEANRVIGLIRDIIEDHYPETGDEVRIQYGGSVKPHNIEEFIQEDNIDGALVGGASLDAESFAAIVRKTEEEYK